MWLEGENGLIRLSHTLSNDCTDTQFHQRLTLPRKISNYSNQKNFVLEERWSSVSDCISAKYKRELSTHKHYLIITRIQIGDRASGRACQSSFSGPAGHCSDSGMVWYGHCSDYCCQPLSRDCSNVHQRQRSAYKARRCWQPLPKSDRARLADCWTPHTLAETKKDHDKKTAYCSTDTKKEVCMYWGPVFTPIC